MEFNIRKNATLPLLKMQMVDDGRGEEFDSFMGFIESSTLYFSMIDSETGSYKIFLDPAGFVEKTQIEPNAKPEYYIYYRFPKKYTNKPGRYEGEFVLKNSDGTLVLPIREKLYINIQESYSTEDIDEVINLALSAVVSSGSTVINYVLTSTAPVKYQTTVNFTHTFQTFSGDPLVITTGLTINSGSKVAAVTITLPDFEYNNLTQESSFSNILVFPVGLRSYTFINESVVFTIPSEQNITDAILTGVENEYISVGNNFYLRFVDPEIITDAILADDETYIKVSEGVYLKFIDPSITPSVTPTNTATPTITPTLTPTITPTPSITPIICDSVTFSGVNITTTSNSITKTSAGGWDAMGYSLSTYSGPVSVTFQISASGYLMGGFSYNPTAHINDTYQDISYGLYIQPNFLEIYENGNQATVIGGGVNTESDIWKVDYDGVDVKYYKNNTLLYTSSNSVTQPLYIFFPILNEGLGVTNICVVSGPTPTPTSSVTPTMTPTPTQQPLYPLTLFIQPLSGGQAIIFDGITYTGETTVNISLNTFYNIEAVPTPGYDFSGWNIYGGSFSSTGQSTTVAISLTSGANLAPSYVVNPNYDALQDQMTTNLSEYDSAIENDWVKITKEEYDSIFENVDGVIKIGNNDTQINTRDLATGFQTTTFGTVDANTPLTIPTGYYVVGFIAESWNQNGQVQLGYTTTFHTGAPTYFGNSPNIIGGQRSYYVRKRPYGVEGSPASQDLYPVLNFISPAYPNSVVDTYGWQTPNSGTTWLETNSSSQTAKIQILLTNVRTWPTPPPSPTPTPTNTQTPTITPTITPTPNYIPFISKWNVSSSVELPYSPTGFYNGTIDWGDGNISANTYNNRSHTYDTPGVYTITITGRIEGWSFRYYGLSSPTLLTEVLQFGTIRGENNTFDGMFFNCVNLNMENCTDTPNLGGITSTSYMFYQSGIRDIANSNSWNLSSVEDMSYMFNSCFNFNSDISNWDVSNVIDTSYMFQYCNAFNSNISNWDVSNVTNTFGMFNYCWVFNQNISNWNLSKVTRINMALMFYGALSFNQDLSSWCVPLISLKPPFFDLTTPQWVLPKPIWGTCPSPSPTPTPTNTQTPTNTLTPTVTPSPCERIIVVPTLWNGATSVNTNSIQLNETSETLQIQAGDTITDNNLQTRTVVTVFSNGTYTFVGTGGVAFNCQFPLTFTGPC